MAESIDTKRTGQMMQAVLEELRIAGQPTSGRELMERAAPKLNLTAHETAVLEKTGYVRWQSVVHWFSVDCVKAGYITKSGGRWSLTPKGEAALKMSPEDFCREAWEKYDEWKRSNPGKPQPGATSSASKSSPPTSQEEIIRQAAYEQGFEQARTEIERHIGKLGPYEFQKFVAELLIGMGYHVPFIAPPGPDGGIDIVAYKDPLGTTSPRIRCQVKHRPQNKVVVSEVRALEGVLRKEGDMGLIVSSGGFTSESMREIQISSKHIETMDLDRLITLWQEHYDRLREQGKMLVPLVKVYFLAPPEEQ
jgi:restriction system protein